LRDEFRQCDDPSISLLLNIIDPIYDAHSVLLKEVEQRLGTTDNRGPHSHRVADILLKAIQYLPVSRATSLQHVFFQLNISSFINSFLRDHSDHSQWYSV